MPPTPVQHTTYVSADPLEVREFIDRAYGAELQIASTRGADWRVTLDQHRTDRIALLDLDLPLDLSFHTRGQDEYAFVTRIAGTGELSPGQECERFGPGDLFVGVTPETDRIHRTHHSRSRSVNIRSTVFDDVLDGADGPTGHWHFTSSTPVAGGRVRWNRSVRMLETMLAEPESSATALTLGPMIRLLAATALSVFSNTVGGGSREIDHHDGHPDTLRRAIAFIDANPDLDITLADVARAAHVTPRAIQLAFRRHLDTTPMAYLRRVRLHHAHLELLAAAPGEGLTVGRVAFDWGFASPSRFAALYRATYGHPPRETLDAG